MTQIGLNHYLSVAKTLKNNTRALYEGVLGATVQSPRPDVDIFTFANGSSMGIFYVAAREVLTPAQHMHALWLEFEVDDQFAAIVRLAKFGMQPFEYFNDEPKYFSAPGGQVFGIAKR